MRLLCACNLLLMLLSTGLSAQSLPGSDFRFAVAAVKPNKSGALTYSESLLPFAYINVPLRTFVLFAHDLRDFQLSGGPNWVNTERFDVNAKAPEGTKPTLEQTRQMVRSLLEERFKLVVRRVKTTGTVYHLKPARSDGRVGEHLRRAKVDCTSQKTPAVARRDPTVCGLETKGNLVTWRGRPLSSLVFSIASRLRVPIEDRTGLSGAFDYELRWNRNDSADSPDPSLETALEEQLGLKLQSQRGLIETAVIDHVEYPAPD